MFQVRTYVCIHAVSFLQILICCSSAVPLPIVTISASGVHYEGTSLSLTCTTELDPAVDGGVTVESTWTGPGGAVLSSDGRVSISGGNDSTSPYMSVFMLSELYPGDSGTYLCSVAVRPTDSPQITTQSMVVKDFDLNGTYENCNGKLLKYSFLYL